MENHPVAHVKKSNFPGSKPYVVATAFFSLLAIVGFALYGLPFFYDFFVKEFGWSRCQQIMYLVLLSSLAGRVIKKLFAWFYHIDMYRPDRNSDSIISPRKEQ